VPAATTPLSPETLLGLDNACDAFESLWQRGERPAIENFLGAVPESARSLLLQELIRTELEWRFFSGDTPTTDEYSARFPFCAAEIATWLVEARAAAKLLSERGPASADQSAIQPGRDSEPAVGLTDRPTAETLEAPTVHAVGDRSGNEMAQPQLPRRLGAYEVLERLGQGGMGEVYRARHVHLDRLCALKVMAAGAVGDAGLLARFQREALAAGRLEHPNLVRTTDAGEADGTWFLAMELLEGEDLARRTRRLGRWPASEACDAIRQAALGLQHAHERGLVHRDIKPANLFRTTDGMVKVLDLGLARLCVARRPNGEGTSVGAFLGTADYAAPEQFLDAGTVEATADIYSLGCTLFDLLTGTPPFGDADHATTVSKAAAHLSDPPPDLRAIRPDLPERLEDVVARMLAKKPEDRLQSAAEVASTLDAFTSDNAPTQPTAVTELPQPSRRPKRRRPAVILVALALVAGVGGGLATWLSARRPGPRPSGLPPTVATPTAERPGGVPFKGWIDVRIYSKADGRQNLGLADEGALPLRPGDQFRIEAAVAPAGYLYVLAIDTEGKVDPVYPWQPGRWGTRPAEEQPLSQLGLPLTLTRGYRVTGTEEGMQAVVLLVRQTPLDCRDEELQAALEGIPAQRPLPGRTAAAWFEDGREVREEVGHRRTGWEESDVASPVLRLQALLAERLRKYAEYTRAVIYAKVGK
jgi:serine/threonine protein kinase